MTLRVLTVLLAFATVASARDDVRLRVTTHKQRNSHTLTMFKKLTGHPHGWAGCQIDHRLPLKRGGLDVWWNCQWLPVEAKRLKDRWE
jgi:hypothetical protein